MAVLVKDGVSGEAFAAFSGANAILICQRYNVPVGAFDLTFNHTPPPATPPDLSRYTAVLATWRQSILPPPAGGYAGVGVTGTCTVEFNGTAVLSLSGSWSITGSPIHYWYQFTVAQAYQVLPVLGGYLTTIRLVGSYYASPPIWSNLLLQCYLLRSKP